VCGQRATELLQQSSLIVAAQVNGLEAESFDELGDLTVGVRVVAREEQDSAAVAGITSENFGRLNR
jgi:ribosomal protein L5